MTKHHMSCFGLPTDPAFQDFCAKKANNGVMGRPWLKFLAHDMGR